MKIEIEVDDDVAAWLKNKNNLINPVNPAPDDVAGRVVHYLKEAYCLEMELERQRKEFS